MKLKKVLAGAMVGSALVFSAVGAGVGVANADRAAPAPLRPPGDPCPPWGCNGRDNGPGWRDNGPGWQRNDWDKGQWWATNRHDWWDDRNGAPPWGWGPPPAYDWDGGPPHPFNYWGYDVNPVWNGFQWGIWLFGIWIPIFGIGPA
jgi:hypothetical protein